MNAQICSPFLFAAGMACSPAAQGTGCVTGPRSALKVAGKVRGIATDASGARDANIGFPVWDSCGAVRAEMTTDAHGGFSLDASSLPVGTYRFETTTRGWRAFIGNFEVVKDRFKVPKRALAVRMGFDGCDTSIARW